eukprot:7282323-Pyramimonas_sp.AAC.1
MAQHTETISHWTLWAVSGRSNLMLNGSISFLAGTFHVPPRRSTAAFCCGAAAEGVIRRRPMSSSSLENPR